MNITGPTPRDEPGERDKTIRTRFRCHLFSSTSLVNMKENPENHTQQHTNRRDSTRDSGTTKPLGGRLIRLNGLREMRTRLGIYFVACPKFGKGRAVAVRQTNTRHRQTNTRTQHKMRIAHNPDELESTKTLL